MSTKVDREALPLSRQSLARSGRPPLKRKRSPSTTPAPTEPSSSSSESSLDEDVTYARSNKQLDYMLDVGSLATDSSHVARMAKHDLSSHLFYNETVRRGLLRPETKDEEAVAESIRGWTNWPLTMDEMPEAYADWSLADEVLAIVNRSTAQEEEKQLEVDELVGGSIALTVQAAVEGILGRLASTRPAAGTLAKTTSDAIKRNGLPIDWRALLVAAEEMGVSERYAGTNYVSTPLDSDRHRIIDRTHERLSALYRPQDFDGALISSHWSCCGTDSEQSIDCRLLSSTFPLLLRSCKAASSSRVRTLHLTLERLSYVHAQSQSPASVTDERR